MCGVAGFLDTGSAGRDQTLALLLRMTNAISHRGPDDSGTWLDSEAGVALGHRRLSIVDLSVSGHQPMLSANGRYVIAYNGEIYNHQLLRRELGETVAAWRGHSDTEVMLAAFERWGVEGALSRFNGMFAFALWDIQERVLHLARDRMGEKPMYFGWMGNVFLFASELKALKTHPAWRSEIDRGALALYMRHTHVPAPYSIYANIQKLLPAHVISVPISTARGVLPGSRPYWSAKTAAEMGVGQPLSGSDAAVIESLDILLRDAVALRMQADVPLGAFLSGGIDSSTVVALMQVQSTRPVKTFSIGFHEGQYNEAEHAKAVSSHLGTDHTELYVSAAEAMAVIPRLPEIYDEPFADSSQIPTFLVSRMTRQHVTVALSGDGGDELFGGYNRYFWGRQIWQRTGRIPKSARAVMSRTLTALRPERWDGVFAALKPILPKKLAVSLPGDKLHKLAGVLSCASPEEMYRGLVTFWEPDTVVLAASEPLTALTDPMRWADLPDFTQRMMFLDQVSYLPEDILAKVDRASMAVSLEARVPLLDHRVVEFAWTLRLHMNIRNGQRKWALRQVLDRYVPTELIERPKMGFGVPIDLWLRGPLREWAEDLLDDTRLRSEGYLIPEAVREKWNEHLSGSRNWASQLWAVLMFQAWLRRELG